MGIRWISRPDRVEILADTVIKKGNQSRIALELAATTAAHELATASGEFRVPRILDYDCSAGIFVSERIRDLAPLSAVPESRLARHMMRRAGRTLALIHLNLELPRPARILSALTVLRRGRVGTVHGDFNSTNVGVDMQRGELVVLDWSSAPAYGPAFTLATQELDLAHFARSLFLSHEAGAAIPPDEGWFEFLKGYERLLGQWDRQALDGMLRFVTRAGLMKQLRQGRIRSAVRSLVGERRLVAGVLINE